MSIVTTNTANAAALAALQQTEIDLVKLITAGQELGIQDLAEVEAKLVDVRTQIETMAQTIAANVEADVKADVAEVEAAVSQDAVTLGSLWVAYRSDIYAIAAVVLLLLIALGK